MTPESPNFGWFSRGFLKGESEESCEIIMAASFYPMPFRFRFFGG